MTNVSTKLRNSCMPFDWLCELKEIVSEFLYKMYVAVDSFEYDCSAKILSTCRGVAVVNYCYPVYAGRKYRQILRIYDGRRGGKKFRRVGWHIMVPDAVYKWPVNSYHSQVSAVSKCCGVVGAEKFRKKSPREKVRTLNIAKSETWTVVRVRRVVSLEIRRERRVRNVRTRLPLGGGWRGNPSVRSDVKTKIDSNRWIPPTTLDRTRCSAMLFTQCWDEKKK